MIVANRRTWLESIKYRLIPSYRRKVDEETLRCLTKLTAQPWLPCQVDGVVIPNGYGQKP